MFEALERFHNGPAGRRWCCYAVISFVAFGYGVVNHLVLGRSEAEVGRECLALIAVLLILGPLVFQPTPEQDYVRHHRIKWQFDAILLSPADLLRAETLTVERTTYLEILPDEAALSKMRLAEAFLSKHIRDGHSLPRSGGA